MPKQCIAGFGTVAAWPRRAWCSCRLGWKKTLSGYRLLKTHDRRLLDEWMANWNDLVDFVEVSPVTTPEEAGEKVAARMKQATVVGGE